MSKSTFRILFYVRKNQVNKEGKASIMIRLTSNVDTAQFSSRAYEYHHDTDLFH